jgi:RNA polymerase sigma-70 factor (ECF subfamily)
MHDSRENFEELMRRVRQGCPGAAQEVYDRFNPHVQRIVRRYLARRLRRQYDSLDFLQEIWTSFFLTPADRYTFDRPADLINFLARVATNKVVEAYRHRLQTAKHDLTRELPIAELPSGDVPVARAAVAAEPPGREPTPSQLTIAEERWQLLLRGQPPRCRRVLELLRQGHTYREVSEQTGVHHKVIQRLVRKLGERVDAG